MKRPIAALSIALLALGLTFGIAAFASEATPQSPETPATAPSVPAAPQGAQLEAEAPQSPLESTDELEKRVDPSRELFNEKIRACTSTEEQQCAPGCACIVVSNTVRCFC